MEDLCASAFHMKVKIMYLLYLLALEKKKACGPKQILVFATLLFTI